MAAKGKGGGAKGSGPVHDAVSGLVEGLATAFGRAIGANASEGIKNFLYVGKEFVNQLHTLVTPAASGDTDKTNEKPFDLARAAQDMLGPRKDELKARMRERTAAIRRQIDAHRQLKGEK